MNNRFHTVVAIILCILHTNAAAFDGFEHERVSDSAVLLGVSYWLAQQSNAGEAGTLCDQFKQHFPGQEVTSLIRHCNPKSEAVTYGGVTRLVDELLYPGLLFAHAGNYDVPDPDPMAYSRPASYKELNNQFNVRHEQRHLNRTAAAILEGYRALSYNEVHFQNDLLLQLQEFNRGARFAAAEKDIYYALVSNALSDHFLQDFLAPGHILWPRNQSHDSVATSAHDRTNQKGTEFLTKTEFWEDHLLDIAIHLEQLPQESTVRMTLQKYWVKRRPKVKSECVDGEMDANAEFAGGVDEGLACIRRAMSSTQDPGYFTIYGDGLISKSPAQQMLLILAQAERVALLLDVSVGKNRRPQYRPNNIIAYGEDYKELLVPCAGLEFGDYQFVRGPCNEEYQKSSEVFHDSISDVLLLAVGGQAPFSSGSSSRLQFGLEYLPLEFMGNHDKIRNASIQKPADFCNVWCNVGISFGADYIHDDDFYAFGGGVRVIKAFPNINFQLSGYAKSINYNFAQQDEWKLTGGLRADWGFSIGSFYVTVGNDYFVNSNARLESTGVVSFGIGFGLPLSRVRKWTADNRRYRPEKDYRYEH